MRLHMGGECDAVLTEQVLFTSLDRTRTLAYLSLISQVDWQQHSKDISSGFSFLGLDANADYATFDQRRSEYLQLHNYNYAEKESLSLFSRQVPDSAIQAWTQCMASKTFRGIALAVKDHTADTVIVKMYFSGQGPDPQDLSLTVQNGALAAGQTVPPQVAGNQEYVFIYTRTDPSKDFWLTATAGAGYGADDVKVPGYVPPVAITPPPAGWIFINVKDPNFQLVGTTGNTVGWLVFAGKWCPYGLAHAVKYPDSNTINECCKDILVKNAVTGATRWTRWFRPPYERIEPNSQVFCRVSDAPGCYGDNDTWPADPPRCNLFIGVPPAL
jgi:hypothetical protein